MLTASYCSAICPLHIFTLQYGFCHVPYINIEKKNLLKLEVMESIILKLHITKSVIVITTDKVYSKINGGGGGEIQ